MALISGQWCIVAITHSFVSLEWMRYWWYASHMATTQYPSLWKQHFEDVNCYVTPFYAFALKKNDVFYITTFKILMYMYPIWIIPHIEVIFINTNQAINQFTHTFLSKIKCSNEVRLKIKINKFDKLLSKQTKYFWVLGFYYYKNNFIK